MPFAYHSRHRHEMERMAAGNMSFGSFSSMDLKNSVMTSSLDHLVGVFDFMRMAGLLFAFIMYSNFSFSILSLQLRRRRFLKAGEGGFRPKLPPTP